MKIRFCGLAVGVICSLTLSSSVVAQQALMTSAPASQTNQQQTLQSLDGDVQTLKDNVLQINRELGQLERDLLFPTSSQLVVFVSMQVDKAFDLNSVRVKLDDKIVASYLYNEQEVLALRRGAMQRLYLGNVSPGPHELEAYLIGGPRLSFPENLPTNPSANSQRSSTDQRSTVYKFAKDSQPKYVELHIQESSSQHQPEFRIKAWE